MKKIVLKKKDNEILFVFSIITLMVYSIYALLHLITLSNIPLTLVIVIILSIIVTISLAIYYDNKFILNTKPVVKKRRSRQCKKDFAKEENHKIFKKLAKI
ncbi:MAG: hypothetical protein PHD02_02505 [Bacilli bacterium]|nr:hypothetical protein [Bacilli bacterium]